MTYPKDIIDPTMHSKRKVIAAKMQTKLAKIRSEMTGCVVDRTAEIDGLLAALVAGEHLLMIGPPGSGKSMLARLLVSALDGISTSDYFEWMLTKYSTPDEIFGPLSLAGLKNDSFRRVTKNKLPEASVAFLDEIFKANSSILNTLLPVINERLFHNDGVTSVPLIMCIGASNELPEGKELEALFDRFMLRYWTDYISDRDDFKAMLTSSATPQLTTTFTLTELAMARADAKQVIFDGAATELLCNIKSKLESMGTRNSDRRWKHCISLLRAHAYVCGVDIVSPDHFLLLADALWREPKDRPELFRAISKLANPSAQKATELLDAAKEEFRKIPFTLHADVDPGEVAAVVTRVNGILKKQTDKLKRLRNGSPNKAIDDAISEVDVMRKRSVEFATKLMTGM